MADKSYEAIIIGAGPGGYPAGIRLGQLGVKTLVVEKEYYGGVCLNWGCIPSKALIAAANTYLDMQQGVSAMGITAKDVSIDIDALQDWKEGIVKKLTGGVQGLLKANKADSMMGTAKLVSKNTVEVTKPDGGKETIEATKGIVIGTGAKVIELPGMEIDGETVISAREAVSLREAKGTMVVVGGGIIGMELGMVYQKLGMKVVVVELLPQILTGVDRDLVRVVQKAFEKTGGEIHTEAKVEKIDKSGGKAKVTVATKDGESFEIDADKVLMAVGFKPNSDGLGLEDVGVKTDDKGHILVDERLETNVKGVYAIGDVIGAPYLAHKATKEGEIVAEVIAGHKAAVDWRAMPSAIFTEPEIATVGLTEEAAKEAGREVKIGKFPFSASGRAMAVRHTDGFIKTIVDAEDHEVLGVSIVGPEASDLISEATLAIEMCAFAEDVHLTIHPHPTLGEAMMEGFKHALGEAVHILNR
ncbi:MAG TPA: dihydrolipoyl dehydrogenase [Sandaracinaceae bacterium LLY-WYZ-13_1]|nr:dihydrolipoyl dehydrogenase [Sandaracinaceae bacterium LLY-WYZ-13_1]